MPVRLTKILPLRPKHHSALWAPNNIEGLLLAKQHAPNRQDQLGWCWIVLDDDLPRSLQRLRGQIFPTQQQARQALQAALEL